MPTTLPTPIKFRLPDDWLPARPEHYDVAFAAVHPEPDAGFTANITIDGTVPVRTSTLDDLADGSVQQLREVAESVEVADRREVGAADAPALTQRLNFSAVIDGARRDLVQSQVYLPLADVRDPDRRAVIRLSLTTTAAQHNAVLKDFQDFVRTVRPDTATEA